MSTQTTVTGFILTLASDLHSASAVPRIDLLSHFVPSFSEPLYIVGAADLGTSAPNVDGALAKILKISATWGAVVLIDEADVFLEERALHHIERNAMVAVFLRHLEYVS